MSRTLTIHDLDAPVAERLSVYATRKDKSLDQAVKELLAFALGVASSPRVRRDNGLGAYYGTISARDCSALLKFAEEADFSKVDPEDE